MKKFTLLIAMLLLSVINGYSQAPLYSFTQSNGTYVPITGGTVVTTSTDGSPNLDSYVSSQQALPAPFQFAGTTYNNFYVTGNGQLALGTTSPSAYNYTVLSSSTGGNVFLSPLSADLDEGPTGVATIRYEMVGSEIVVQWTNFRRYNRTESYNFQVRMNTTTGAVKFVYDGTPPYDTSTSYQPQVGIKSAAGSYSAVTVATGGSWNSPTVITTGITSSSTAALTGSNGFTSGLTYTWEPPVPCSGTPMAGTVNGDLIRTVCNGSTPSAISVSGVTPAVNGITYQWQESLNGTDWVSVTGGTGATTVSYTPPAYSGTPIQYRLKVTCANSNETVYSSAVSITNQTAPTTQTSDLVAATTTNTTIKFNFTNGNGARRYVLISNAPITTDPVSANGVPAYTANTTFAGSGQQLVYDGTGSTVTVSGLSCNTTYYAKVYEYNRCGSGPYDVYFNTATTTNEVSATTTQPATAVALPVENNFTGFTGANLSDAVPGWYEASVSTSSGAAPVAANPMGTTSAWRDGSVLGMSAARINLYTDTRNEWIISPKIELTNDSRLKFKAAITNYSSAAADPDGMQGTDDKVQVLISTDGCGATWTSLYTFNAANTTGLTNVLTDYEILLDAYTGQTVQLAFQATDGPVNDLPDYDFHIGGIVVELIPECDTPSVAIVSDIDKESATITWEAPSTSSPTSYQYVVSTTNATPGVAGTSTNDLSADITGLMPSTDYFVFVRSECSGSFSEWTVASTFTTLCDYNEVLTTTPATICGIGTADVMATAEGGTITWYADMTGGNVLGTGGTFTTEEIDETTTYYVTAQEEGTATAGGARVSTTSSSNTGPSNYGLIFDAYSSFMLNSVDVYLASSSAGTLELRLRDSAGNDILSASVAVPAGNSSTPVLHTINLGWEVPAGEDMRIVALSGPSLVRELSLGGYPYAIGSVGSVTDGYVSGTINTTYYYFYNWNYNEVCAGPRVPVTVTVTDAPEITVSGAGDICPGESAEISVTSDNADYTYSWMPGNLTGATQSVTPAETTTYTVTATDAVSGCVNVAEVTIQVNPAPDTPAITPAAPQVCIDEVVALTVSEETEFTPYCIPAMADPQASGDYLNNFSFADIVNNNSGDAADDYTYYDTLTANVIAGNSYPVSLQTGGSTSLYAQQYRIWIDFNQDGVFSASESVFNTTSSTTSSTVVTGTIQIPFTAKDGLTRMRVASKYSSVPGVNDSCTSTSDYGEYEDYNVMVTGMDYVWTPSAGLYLDEAATMPYNGEAASTVYALASTTTTYTVTATSGLGCSVDGTVEVTVNIVDAPTVDNTDITVCGGSTVTDLMATGDNIQWYTTETEGDALTTDTALVTGMYYASQTVDGCESTTRTMVNVTVNQVAAPTVDNTDLTICNAGTVAELMATGDNIQWYTTETGGEALTTDTALVTGMYYASQTVDGCESTTRTMVNVTVNQVAAPTVDNTDLTICNAGTVAELMATGDNIQWYASETGGEALTSDTDLADGTTYYASQTIDGCESMIRTAVAVTVTTVNAPTGDANQTITADTAADATIEDITVDAEGTVIWYPTEADALAGNGNAYPAGTELIDGETYYAVQVIGNCASETALAVTVSLVLSRNDFDNKVFSYYPNPVKDVLNITYTSEITSVTMYNLLGQEVMALQPNTNEVKVDMSNLSDGTYLLNVVSGSTVKAIKVVKKQ